MVLRELVVGKLKSNPFGMCVTVAMVSAANALPTSYWCIWYCGTGVLWFHRYLIFLLLTQEHLKTPMDIGITLDKEKLFVPLLDRDSHKGMRRA